MGNRKKKKIIGAAAGAAAAATAVGIAAARMKNSKPVIFHVRAGKDEWTVSTDGAEPISRHGTKRLAVKDGRDLAARKAPSRLVIHRRDGSVQKEHAYQPED